jgi:hypothetical protein
MTARRWVMLLSGLSVAVVAALWLVSGRERLSKSDRSVTVEVRDPFGDPMSRVQFERGPIFGYFVGLDAVLLTAGAAAIATGTALIVHRLRTPRGPVATRRT